MWLKQQDLHTRICQTLQVLNTLRLVFFFSYKALSMFWNKYFIKEKSNDYFKRALK